MRFVTWEKFEMSPGCDLGQPRSWEGVWVGWWLHWGDLGISRHILNFWRRPGHKSEPSSGPNSVLGHFKFRHVSKLITWLVPGFWPDSGPRKGTIAPLRENWSACHILWHFLVCRIHILLRLYWCLIFTARLQSTRGLVITFWGLRTLAQFLET